jgi:hypothetical protein
MPSRARVEAARRADACPHEMAGCGRAVCPPMKPLHIFRAGRHTPMRGEALEFSESDLAAMAAAYDPALSEAPLVVGHPATDAPAYGWVASLRAEGADLIAEPRQVEPQFAELVKDGRFKHRSASFYPPQHPRNPKPGAYYLKHVGFLGAAPPAVKGLKPVAFADDDGVVTLQFAAEPMSPWRLSFLIGDIGALFRGLRDWFVAEKGVEQADRLLPPSTVARIAEEAARMQGEADATARQGAATEAPPAFASNPDKTEDTVTDKTTPGGEDATASLRRDLDAANARLAQFAEDAARARRAEAEAFVTGLVKEARLPAGLAPRVVAFMEALPSEGEVSFSEGGKDVKLALRDVFRGLLQAVPASVAFGEAAGGDGPGGGDGAPTADFAGVATNPDRMAVHRKALAYQRAHPGADYVTAVMAVDLAG